MSMWPLYFGGIIDFYPGSHHSRIMAFGFFGGFMMGFLLTALPRLAGFPAFRLWEVWVILIGYFSVSLCHFFGWAGVAAWSTLIWISVFAVMVARRVLQSEDCLPPGFCLVGLGFLSAWLGTIVTLVERSEEIDPEWLILRQLLQFQGFLLLPVMGVGGFMLPRILGLPERQGFPSGVGPTKSWWHQFSMALVAALFFFISCWIEVKGHFVLAYALRFLAVMLYLTWVVPWPVARERGHFVRGLQVGLGALVGGLLLAACFPIWRLAFIHLTLGIGLVLVTLVVASRVLLGHRDRLGDMEGRQRWFLWVVVAIVVGVSSRMIGDMLPRIMVSHYNYGALFFAIGLLYWAKRLLWAGSRR